MDKEKNYLKDAICFQPSNSINSFKYSKLDIERCFLSLDILYNKIQAKCEADATFKTNYFKQITTLDKLIIERDAAQLEDGEDWEPGNESEDWAIDYQLTDLNRFLQHNPDLYREAFRNKEKKRTDRELEEIKIRKEKWEEELKTRVSYKLHIYPYRPA